MGFADWKTVNSCAARDWLASDLMIIDSAANSGVNFFWYKIYVELHGKRILVFCFEEEKQKTHHSHFFFHHRFWIYRLELERQAPWAIWRLFCYRVCCCATWGWVQLLIHRFGSQVKTKIIDSHPDASLRFLSSLLFRFFAGASKASTLFFSSFWKQCSQFAGSWWFSKERGHHWRSSFNKNNYFANFDEFTIHPAPSKVSKLKCNCSKQYPGARVRS